MRALRRFFSPVLWIMSLLICASNAIAGTPPMAQEAKRTPDGGIFKWNGQAWTQVPGAAFRISVAPDGSPWVVNSQGSIYRWLNGSFEQVPGRAKDISVGANGAVWVIGWDNGILRWNGQDWDRVPGEAVTISVQPGGAPWVVNAAGEIYRWVNDHFELQSGRAREIGVERSIWIIDQNGLICKLSRGDWIPDAGPGNTPGNASRISVGPDGTPWVVNKESGIYHLDGDTVQTLPGAAIDIGVGADGSVWMLGVPERSSSGIGGQHGSTMGGSGKNSAGSAATIPPRSEAGPVLGGPSSRTPPQKFQYPPTVISGIDSLTFKFVTTQPTIPLIEVSKRPPDPGPRFNRAYVVSAVFPVLAGKQTRHNLRVGNLQPGTRYYYIITIADEAGRLITETGECGTSVRL